MALEEYVLAAVLSELTPQGTTLDSAERAFEVQAIVARTYAAANPQRHRHDQFDLCDSTHCQLVEADRPRRSSWAPIARRAVDRTAGVVLVFDGRPAQALYHADCGGHTSAADAVWRGVPIPYLGGVEDTVPGPGHLQAWRFDVAVDRLQRALDGDPVTRVGSRLRDVAIVERDSTGRATQVRIDGARSVAVTGDVFRAVVARAFGPRALRSTRFAVTRTSQEFSFEGRGFGHGVGLCQTGALGRAARGDSARAILAHYYPGTVATRLGETGAGPALPRLRPRRSGR